MSQRCIVEAKNNLSDLIERALKGESVVITRHGKAVVELKSIRPAGGRVTQADVDWLSAHRVRLTDGGESAVELLLRMRVEDWR